MRRVPIGRLSCAFLLSACVRAAQAPAAPPSVDVAEAIDAKSAEPECPRAADELPAARIAKQGTVLDVYHRQDGVWLPHAPVLVNEDFDFALAMGMEGGIGAGLAAGKRKQHNEKRAEALRELRFDDALNARLGELRCCGLDVYFLLWGADGMLKMVVDGKGEEVGAGRVVDGAGAVTAREITQRAEEMLRGMECGSMPAPMRGPEAGEATHEGDAG